MRHRFNEIDFFLRPRKIDMDTFAVIPNSTLLVAIQFLNNERWPFFYHFLILLCSQHVKEASKFPRNSEFGLKSLQFRFQVRWRVTM